MKCFCFFDNQIPHLVSLFVMKEALKWITDQPAWNRSGGRDHILPVHHPWSFKSVRRFVKNAIWLLPDMDSTGNWWLFNWITNLTWITSCSNFFVFLLGINQDKFFSRKISFFLTLPMLIFVMPHAYLRLNPREPLYSFFAGGLKEML